MLDLCRLVKSKREVAGISQKKLGQICGISDSEIMKIENGVRKCPSWENLCKIAKALNFHPFEILLAAGYIESEDIHPVNQLHGLEKLDNAELAEVQRFIDFTLSKRNSDGIAKEDI